MMRRQMRAAAIGDNCIDDYTRLQRRYPTGNAVDFAINLQQLGIPASVISVTGSDENGQWMLESLAGENIDISHLHVAPGATAITYMDMDGDDRVHGDYLEGVLENIEFSDDDLEFASQHDLVHTALWGNADRHLERLRAHGALICFDYATHEDCDLVQRTLPFVDYAFFSFAGSETDARVFLAEKQQRGPRVAVATFGSRGSMAFDGSRYTGFGIYPAEVVNTVGAGDAFIAGFMYGVLNNMELEVCLDSGARTAASIVEIFEPWMKS